MPRHLNQNSKTEGSGRVQWQFKFKTTPRPSSKNMQQTNMLWSSAAGLFHVALPSLSWPFGSSIIGSSLYLSSSYLQHVQIKCIELQDIPKTEQWKLSTSWTAKPWQLWKLLHTSSNESTCVQLHASDIKLLTNENSWHQIQKQWNEHHMNWHHKTWKSKTVATVKHLQNLCTASARWLDGFCKQNWIPWQLFPTQLLQAALYWQLLLFLGQLLHWKTWTTSNTKMQHLVSFACIQVQLTCNEVKKICTPFFWTQLHGSAIWAIGEPRGHNDLFS